MADNSAWPAYYKCPKCGEPASESGGMGRSGIRDGQPFNEPLGTRSRCSNVPSHTWEVSPQGAVTLLPDPPPQPAEPPRERTLFDEWADLNHVIASSRSRFDVLREELPKCKTKKEARRLVAQEDFDQRYPELPDSLPEG